VGTYLITGATGGIGRAVAELLYDEGHELVLTGRSPERLHRLAEHLGSPAFGATQTIDPARLSAPGPPVRTVTFDLAEPRRLEAALALADLPARLDGVVHSAGVIDLGPVAELEADQWIDQLMVNLVGAAELTRLLLPALRTARGHLVFVNSGAGLRARASWSAYAASKHGLKALADSLRAEEPALAVTSVYPGRTASEMQKKARTQESASYLPESYIQPLTVARVIVNALATPRDAVLTDISISRAR
jgi:short-subunit dehydrogenase